MGATKYMERKKNRWVKELKDAIYFLCSRIYHSSLSCVYVCVWLRAYIVPIFFFAFDPKGFVLARPQIVHFTECMFDLKAAASKWGNNTWFYNERMNGERERKWQKNLYCTNLFFSPSVHILNVQYLVIKWIWRAFLYCRCRCRRRCRRRRRRRCRFLFSILNSLIFYVFVRCDCATLKACYGRYITYRNLNAHLFTHRK